MLTPEVPEAELEELVSGEAVCTLLRSGQVSEMIQGVCCFHGLALVFEEIIRALSS